MYQIQNKANQYYLVFNSARTYLGNKQDMLEYLINTWHLRHSALFENGQLIFQKGWKNHIFDNYSFTFEEYHYTIVDGLNKVINIFLYQQDSLNAAKKKLDEDESSYYNENHNKYGIYRKTPVPYTKKSRGGPSQKVRKTARLFKMYADPEQKDYNRGTSHGIPSYWDDFPWRKPQKSWKAQRKSKHQYKEKKGD